MNSTNVQNPLGFAGVRRGSPGFPGWILDICGDQKASEKAGRRLNWCLGALQPESIDHVVPSELVFACFLTKALVFLGLSMWRDFEKNS